MKINIAAVLILTGTMMLKAETPSDKSPMSDCPMMSNSAAAMNERGDKAMGFSHDKTTHHFNLSADGGSIEVQANDPADVSSRDQIRMHLGHIAQMFRQGDFQIPMLVHGKKPDGASMMEKHKAEITYTYEETKTGGRVRIRTGNAEALKGVHDFLRFQIAEHQTGDATEVKKKS
jgi:hypothetical protein